MLYSVLLVGVEFVQVVWMVVRLVIYGVVYYVV